MVAGRDSMPTGTVALVFTDIQGSTEAWERLGDAYREVLDAHNAVMRDAIASCGGHEVKTEGDAFMIAFSSARDAVRFTIGAQEALARVLVPDTGEAVLVRMGVHIGEPICQADPITGRMDYFGPMVNRSARVSGAANGGQTLITGAVREGSGDALEGARVKDMGEHRLKGLERLERLYEVVPASWGDRTFPPLRTLTSLPTNMPAQSTNFIGRRREWQEISELILEEGVRLVTLSGPGGIGKTRLSLRVGGEVLDRFEGGVWFVELEEATTAEAVASRVAAALGVPTGTKGPVEAVAAALEVRPETLLILDNFEQVVEAAPETVGLWMKRAPKAKAIVSSRILLGVGGEREYALEPLPDPRAETRPYAERDAVRLFVDRAKAANARFELSDENGADIVEVCAQLDGIPLAIELAAARAKVMKPAQIRQRLEKRFQLLRSTRRDLPGRQQTLEGAIAWSYDLLESWEKAAFCQACVFRGGFTLESAEAVIDLFDHADAPMAMDAAQILREKSLLTWSESGSDGEGRFGMYISVRDFGRLRVPDVLDADALGGLMERYIDHYLSFVEEWEEERRGGALREAMDRIEPDIENILHAHTLAHERGLHEEGARLILGAVTTMALRGPSSRRAASIERSIAALEEGDAGLRVLLLCALAQAQIDTGGWDEAESTAERALGLARAVDDPVRLGDALVKRAEIDRLRGSSERAGEGFREALDAFRSGEEEAGAARAASGLGSLAWQAGRYDEAIELFEEARVSFDALGNRAGAARCLGGLAIVRGERGEHSAALDALEQAEEMCREINDRVGLARTLGNKGIELRELGRLEEAVYCFAEAEVLNRQMGRSASLSRNLGSRAMVMELRGEYESALQCYEQGEEVQRAMGDVPGVALFGTRRARTLVRLERVDDALVALREAIAVLDGGGGSGRVACEAHAWLAYLLESDGDVEGARDHARRSDDLRASLGLGPEVYGADEVSAAIVRLVGDS
ncbi:MAG: LuxR family transcriptional regulator [Phycisphaerales bacterium]